MSVWIRVVKGIARLAQAHGLALLRPSARAQLVLTEISVINIGVARPVLVLALALLPALVVIVIARQLRVLVVAASQPRVLMFAARQLRLPVVTARQLRLPVVAARQLRLPVVAARQLRVLMVIVTASKDEVIGGKAQVFGVVQESKRKRNIADMKRHPCTRKQKIVTALSLNHLQVLLRHLQVRSTPYTY